MSLVHTILLLCYLSGVVCAPHTIVICHNCHSRPLTDSPVCRISITLFFVEIASLAKCCVKRNFTRSKMGVYSE